MMIRLFAIVAVLIAMVPTLIAQPLELDRYGGDKRTTLRATGFFRVETIHERWYFITPDGHPYIAFGGNHVGAFLNTQAEKLGYYRRFAGDQKRATSELLKSLRELGLNAGGAYQPASSR
jgi:hypothetical protein